MALRKAETESLRNSVSEVRAKSAVVGADTDSSEKKVSSKPLYEAIMQQIAYLMSAVVNQTNLNPKKNCGCTGFKCNGNGKYPSTTFQRPKCDRKNTSCWGCGGTGHSWRECPLPDKGITSLFKPNTPNSNPGNRQNLNGQQGGNTNLQSSSSNNQGGVHINGELKPTGAWDDPEYYNLNP